MPSAAELMQPPVLTDYHRQVTQALARDRIDIAGETRLNDPISTPADANNFQEVLTEIYLKHATSETSRVTMSCQDLGGKVLKATFTPEGMYGYALDKWAIADGFLHYDVNVTNDLVLPLRQEVFLARLVQTKTPANPFLKIFGSLKTVDAAVATRREVNDATAKAKLFLEDGIVEEVI
ncbi:MAG TPA: hypothetical protein VFN31_01160 [Candidatus Saccharimonadales bacterium]|nr:hypothetical protein [Candidatus Saccharimonadales bacterium]